ncbi:hypothetical protein HMPREF9952_1731 [Haemophilus pittmaniae HK 85]|uniref:Uncharacterized protein n=1 Tax=Haemophilus pittmaniae HK 85 TaxID=1035188 RepID=F9Q7X7_9PAST|nr:hypothetical protein HMPREF9952_1731 [Haemophilus pittmaniae HK 85]
MHKILNEINLLRIMSHFKIDFLVNLNKINELASFFSKTL